MQLVITINDDGKAVTTALPESGPASGAGTFDGGNAPTQEAETAVAEVTEMSPPATEVTFDGGSL